MLGPLLPLASLLACDAQDYGLQTPDPQNEPGFDTIQVSIDVALQKSADAAAADPATAVWRCHVQVAFKPMMYDPEAEGEDPLPPTNGTVIEAPETPGTCVSTLLPDPAEGETEDPGPMPGDPDDTWQLVGTLAGPEALFLENETTSLALPARGTSDGGLRYELPDCDLSIFPFGQTLDLVVPDYARDPDDPPGLDPFEVEGAIAVGARLLLESPLPGPETPGALERQRGPRRPHLDREPGRAQRDPHAGVDQPLGPPHAGRRAHQRRQRGPPVPLTRGGAPIAARCRPGVAAPGPGRGPPRPAAGGTAA